MHDDPQRPAGTNGDGRSDAKLATHNEIAGALHALLAGPPERAQEIALVAAERQLATDVGASRGQSL